MRGTFGFMEVVTFIVVIAIVYFFTNKDNIFGTIRNLVIAGFIIGVLLLFLGVFDFWDLLVMLVFIYGPLLFFYLLGLPDGKPDDKYGPKRDSDDSWYP